MNFSFENFFENEFVFLVVPRTILLKNALKKEKPKSHSVSFSHVSLALSKTSVGGLGVKADCIS